MKVRVSYTVEAPYAYRRAINIFYGKPGLASRDDVKRWLQAHGESMDADILHDFWSAVGRGEEKLPS